MRSEFVGKEPSICAYQSTRLLKSDFCLEHYSRVLLTNVFHFGQSFVSGFLLGVNDMEEVPGAFWVCLGTNRVSVQTNIVVCL